MKNVLRLSLFFCLVTVELSRVTLAEKSNPVIPFQRDSNIEFVFSKETTDIDPAAMLRVYVGTPDACCDGRSPVAGSYTVDGQTLVFNPAFDFIEGQRYTIKTQDGGALKKQESLLTGFTIEPTNHDPIPKVTAIFPSGDSIPENTLRFYIHFSTPVKPQVASSYIKLVDENGLQDTEAFMEFKQELWSEDRRRLTVLMDPGRIKRGVAQNLALGSALIKGNSYSMVIESGWPTANGLQSLPRFERRYSISEALRTLPDVSLWSVVPPKTTTRDPLVIKFDRPFDHQLLQSGITVLDERGRTVPGSISVENQEKTWLFYPQRAWRDINIKLSVDAWIEDVAGNNFRELLDHSVDENIIDIRQKIIDIELLPASK